MSGAREMFGTFRCGFCDHIATATLSVECKAQAPPLPKDWFELPGIVVCACHEVAWDLSERLTKVWIDGKPVVLATVEGH